MTNFEKYKEEILAGIDAGQVLVPCKDGSLMVCDGFGCQQCILYFMADKGAKRYACTRRQVKWLYEEYKEPAPKLTLEERHFCEAFPDGYGYCIRRDHKGDLYLECGETVLMIYKDLFAFIKPKQTWAIQFLRKLEVEK